MELHKVEVDWNTIHTEEQMWDELVYKSGHPWWHGRNLNALHDGWETGGLDQFGPPNEFVFNNCG